MKNFVAVIGLLLAVGGCKSEEEKAAERAATELAKAQAHMAEAQKKMQESAQQMGKAGAEAAAQGVAAGTQAAAAGLQAAAAAMAGLAKGGGGTAALVDFRKLKELLPESIAGFKRTSASGEKSGAMGMGISQAEGKYEGEGKASLRVKLIDTAGVGGLAIAGMAMAGMEIDKESEHGYERTSTVDGRKIFEKYDSRSKSGEVKVLVSSRFVVEVDADEVPMETVKEVAGKLDLAKLEALAAAK